MKFSAYEVSCWYLWLPGRLGALVHTVLKPSYGPDDHQHNYVFAVDISDPIECIYPETAS